MCYPGGYKVSDMALLRMALVAIASAIAVLPIALPGGAAVPPAASWWRPTYEGPGNGPEFQLELDHALNISSTSDMGYGALNALGMIASNPTVYDIDGISNPASTIDALHQRGDKVMCYIEVGAA